MRRFSLSYLISQSFKGLFRNGVMTFASIAVLFSCLVVVGSCFLLVKNIDYNMQELDALNEIVVFIDESKSEEEIEQLLTQVKQLNNVVEDGVIHTTKEEALEEEKARLSDYPGLFEGLGGENNPYRDSFTISYRETGVALEELLANLDALRDEGIAKINSRNDLANSIEGIKNGVSMIFVWFLVILLVVSIFVIINTIKLAVFSRREEISIMKYVGATDAFIGMPFVFEGLWIGLISSVLAYFVVTYLYRYVIDAIQSEIGLITFIAPGELNITMLLIFLALGIVTGIIGSTISLRKYLKV